MKSKEAEVNHSSLVESKPEMEEQEKIEESGEHSSDESVVEIRLNEFVKQSEVSEFELRALVVRCSSCGTQVNHYVSKDIRRHRKLGVLTCKECYDFYGSSEFSQDESGYNYCTWCGNGGRLVVCDYCPNGFCSTCIRRNFGRAEITETSKEGWKCYCCNRKRLLPKVKFCNLIINSQKKFIKKKKKETLNTNKEYSENWLLSAFKKSEEECKKFHKKMSKLKTISVNKTKSMKRVVKKMEEVINSHKTDLKNVLASLTEQYGAYLELQVKLDQNGQKDRNSNDMDVKNSDNDCIILDSSLNKEPSVEEISDASASILPTKDNVDEKEEKKIQAKLSLLKSSSESDEVQNTEEPADESISLMDTDSQCNEQLDNETSKNNKSDQSESKNNKSDQSESKNNKSDQSESENDKSDQSESKNDKSDQSESKNNNIDQSESKNNKSNQSESKISIKNTPKKIGNNNIKKNNTKRRLSFGFSDSSSSDFEIKKPYVNEILKNVDEKIEEDLQENADNNIEKLVSNETVNKEIDPDTDPKLKLEPKVGLIKCDYLFKEGENSVVIKDDSDAEKKLDRLVDNLIKFPVVKKKPSTHKKQKCGPLCSKKAAAKKMLMESSSSISLSSEEDEDQKKITVGNKLGLKNAGLQSKEKLLDSDSGSDSSSDLSSESEEKEKISKKTKVSKKDDDNDDSSGDFVPVNKKRKYDKLLHKPLFSDDEKKKKEKKGTTKKRQLMSSSEEERKRKNQNNKSEDSDSTSSSSDEGSKKKKPKKRRRIKKIGSSSNEEEDEEKDKDGTPGKGRKNIRKIVSQKKLAVSTKEAQLEEKERRKRISDRQRLYNKIEDTSVDGKEIITRKMVLEVDQDSKEEIVEIHPDLVCKLKPHQVNGVKFMWECTIETVKDLDKPGSGCILAHCMGLGKTLQVIAFLHTCLTNDIINKTITRGMIICPYNTALNWASEFDFWLNDVEGDIKIHQLTTVKSNDERMDILEYWYTEGGVIIVSYDIFRRLAADKIAKIKPKEKKQIYKHLLDPGPDIVVCDEGHVLKNDKSAISVATSKLKTKRRIVLTGTPLQNNLKEYHCMLSFVKPNLLGTSQEFRNRFVNPIINGQYDDSNMHDVKLMKKRIHILHKLLEGCVQRCDYSALTKFLPTKHEFVISVKLSEVQINMYKCYLEKRLAAQKDMKSVGKSLFQDFNNLRSIWTHPYICQSSYQRTEYKRMFKDEEEEDFINDATEPSASSETSGTTSDEDKLLQKIENDKKKNYRTRSKVAEGEEEEEEVEEVIEDKQWFHEFISDDDKFNVELSGKMVLLMDILKECETIGDKIILFSQSLLALNAIEDMLEYSSSQPVSEEDKNRDAIGTWIKGLDYFRMDGGTSADFRKSYIDMFNDPANERSRLFLISTRAGSLGTNLVGANRVIIMDTSWNPSHDVQAIFRVYRFGQIKPVYIYRLIAQGTMEEKIYDRQVTKLSLSCRVVDEQQIDRHFSAADLAELYMFDPHATTIRPTPMVPKDRLLAEMLIKNKEWIVTFHEHDSLLQNQTEEDLTEEERQAAWTEYENEREGRGPATTNAGLNLDDMNTFTREPDFSQDYEDNIIPSIKVIVESLFERLKIEAGEPIHTPRFKELLLSAVFRVRQAFQEKHVKVLRLKQEFCTHGTVPNAVNKYLEELTIALKNTGDYIAKLNAVVQKEKLQESQKAAQQQNNIYLQRMQSLLRPQLGQQQAQRQYIYRHRTTPRMYNQTYAYRGQQYQFPAQRIPFNLYSNNTQTYSTANQQPTVTEVDDNASIPVSNSTADSKKSTVIIEEIS